MAKQVPGEVTERVNLWGKGIRPIPLKRVVLLYYLAVQNGPLHDKVMERVRAKSRRQGYRGSYISIGEMVDGLKPEDAMEWLGVSRRTAWDYLQTPRAIVHY